MVAFMASYLFDHPTHLDDLYNRSQKSTLQSWTLSPVAGNKLADKPAFVLTSADTFSGAEEFSYDLKLLKRATIVGETTRGGAHMVRRHRIDDHFAIGVPDTRPINPISKGNWEGTGVTPDVKVKATDALAIAEGLADKMLHKK
jgi:C-terminal processing protease CtpA/Prc